MSKKKYTNDKNNETRVLYDEEASNYLCHR